MLYLDYSRNEGEWLPNPDGGNDNRDAVRFLQRVNELVYAAFPGAMTIAEEFDLMARRVPPHQRGRTGFRLQVEHGLDERHPGLHGARSHLPALAS